MGHRHLMGPNLAHGSRHRIRVRSRRRLFRIAEKVWRPAAAVTAAADGGDLVHSFNSIPLTNKPWVATFESALPRSIGRGGRWFARATRERLLRDECRALLPISRYALGIFTHQHDGWPGLSDALEKAQVLYPAVACPPVEPKQLQDRPLRLAFVGNDFAQKGGVVALRAVQEADRRGIPVHLDVVSALNIGTFADAGGRSAYAADLKLLELPNVTFHGRVSRSRVMGILHAADVQVLATLDDTFGFSVLEGLAVGTPAITTDVCALPEMVQDGRNGYTLPMEKTPTGQWTGLFGSRSGYGRLLEDTYTRLALGVVDRIEELLRSPALYHQMSSAALDTARARHSVREHTAFLDELYDRVADPS